MAIAGLGRRSGPHRLLLQASSEAGYPPGRARARAPRRAREPAAARTPLYAEVADLPYAPGDLDAQATALQLAARLAQHWQRTGAAA